MSPQLKCHKKGRLMIGRDLIMWSEGQLEAFKTLTWKGDRQIYKLTSQLLERIDLRADSLKIYKYMDIATTRLNWPRGPSQWKYLVNWTNIITILQTYWLKSKSLGEALVLLIIWMVTNFMRAFKRLTWKSYIRHKMVLCLSHLCHHPSSP